MPITGPSEARKEKNKKFLAELNDDVGSKFTAPTTKDFFNTGSTSIRNMLGREVVVDPIQWLYDAEAAIEFAKQNGVTEASLKAASDKLNIAKACVTKSGGAVSVEEDDGWDDNHDKHIENKVEGISEDGIAAAREAERLADFEIQAFIESAQDQKSRIRAETFKAGQSAINPVQSAKSEKSDIKGANFSERIKAAEVNTGDVSIDKYKKMLKAGLPEGAVKQAMRKDGVDPTNIFPAPSAPVDQKNISEVSNVDVKLQEPEIPTQEETEIIKEPSIDIQQERRRTSSSIEEILEPQDFESTQEQKSTLQKLNDNLEAAEAVENALMQKIAALQETINNNSESSLLHTTSPTSAEVPEVPINNSSVAAIQAIESKLNFSQLFVAIVDKDIQDEVAKFLQPQKQKDEFLENQNDALSEKIDKFLDACKRYFNTTDSKLDKDIAQNLNQSADDVKFLIYTLIDDKYPDDNNLKKRLDLKNNVSMALATIASIALGKEIPREEIDGVVGLQSYAKATSIMNMTIPTEAGGGGYCGDSSIVKSLRDIRSRIDDLSPLDQKVSDLIDRKQEGAQGEISSTDAEDFRTLYVAHLESLNSKESKEHLRTMRAEKPVYWLAAEDMKYISQWLNISINVVQNVKADKAQKLGERDTLLEFHPANKNTAVTTINILNHSARNQGGIHYQALLYDEKFVKRIKDAEALKPEARSRRASSVGGDPEESEGTVLQSANMKKSEKPQPPEMPPFVRDFYAELNQQHLDNRPKNANPILKNDKTRKRKHKGALKPAAMLNPPASPVVAATPQYKKGQPVPFTRELIAQTQTDLIQDHLFLLENQKEYLNTLKTALSGTAKRVSDYELDLIKQVEKAHDDAQFKLSRMMHELDKTANTLFGEDAMVVENGVMVNFFQSALSKELEKQSVEVQALSDEIVDGTRKTTLKRLVDANKDIAHANTASHRLIKDYISYARRDIETLAMIVFNSRNDVEMFSDFNQDLKSLVTLEKYTLTLLAQRDKSNDGGASSVLFRTLREIMSTTPDIAAAAGITKEFSDLILVNSEVNRDDMFSNIESVVNVMEALTERMAGELGRIKSNNPGLNTDADEDAINILSSITDSLVKLAVRSPAPEVTEQIHQLNGESHLAMATLEIDYESFKEVTLKNFAEHRHTPLVGDMEMFAEMDRDINNEETGGLAMFRTTPGEGEFDPIKIATFTPSGLDITHDYKPVTQCEFVEGEEHAAAMALLQSVIEYAKLNPVGSKHKYQITLGNLNTIDKADAFLKGYYTVATDSQANREALKQIEIVFKADDNVAHTEYSTKTAIEAVFSQEATIDIRAHAFSAFQADEIRQAGLLGSVSNPSQPSFWNKMFSTKKHLSTKDENSPPNPRPRSGRSSSRNSGGSV